MRVAPLLLSHLALWQSAQAHIPDLPPPLYNDSLDDGSFGLYPFRRYDTLKGVKAPEVNFLKWTDQCDDGLFTFITPRGSSVPRPGPMILDGRGELVWFKHFGNSYGGQAYDFKVQRFQGKDYLTFWLGDDMIRGHGSGFYYMLDSSYETVRKVGGTNGLTADLHEFLITPQGTALLTVYQVIPGDVTEFRDFDPDEPKDKDPNYIWDSGFQEIDIATGELIFEWRASDHCAFNETYRMIGVGGTKEDPFDWYHINSMAKDDLGNYVISARYPHSIAYIDGKTNATLWQLGGKSNSFMDLSDGDGDGINFAWQQDARFLELDVFPSQYTPPPPSPGYTTKLMSIFDNAAEDQHYYWGLDASRGLMVELTFPTPGTKRARFGPITDPQRVSEAPRAGDDGEGPHDRGDFDQNLDKAKSINGTDPDYTVRVIQSFENPARLRSSSQGSMQAIHQSPEKEAKFLVGYGLDAAWTEFAPNGDVLCDVHFGARTSFDTGGIQSYRVYKFPWTGLPTEPPTAKLSPSAAELHVSWNGATEIAEWILQSASSRSASDAAWTEIYRVPKTRFETALPATTAYAGRHRFLRAVALAHDGSRLENGISPPVARGFVAAYFPALDARLPAVNHSPVLRAIAVFGCFASALFILYELLRRWLRYRSRGRGGVRWRKSHVRGVLSDLSD